ncbi:hypothetical protein Tco_1124567 [Tanacetum coccineum]|uniref:Uncharacterized protein n=1 Tax=Tanacetum coccineum TaxID=301880 RepID=A0ABQ5J6I1_9ASTR
MANFPCLQELAFAANSTTLTDAMPVYIEREINADLQFAIGLSNLWDALYNRVNKRRLFIADLQAFGGVLVLQCADFLKQMGQNDVLKLLELRKMIATIEGVGGVNMVFLTSSKFIKLQVSKDPSGVLIYFAMRTLSR